MSNVATESTTDKFVEDIISNKDNESSSEDNPTQGEKNKGQHVEEMVTVGGSLRVCKLDLEQEINMLKGGKD